jgi:hypothetical protein
MHTGASVFSWDKFCCFFIKRKLGNFWIFFASVNSTSFAILGEKNQNFNIKNLDKKSLIRASLHIKKKEKRKKEKKEFITAAQKSRSQKGLDPVGT